MTTKDYLKELIKENFIKKYPYPIDEKGYVSLIKHNILENISEEDFIKELESGSGKELVRKFLAVHSSSALAVNHFASFKRQINKLKLFELDNFEILKFEKKLCTGLGGNPPNLDVFLENNQFVVGIESKFLEIVERKKPSFSASYNKNNLSYLDEIWFRMIEKYKYKNKMFLDASQLIKHSIGLIKKYSNKQIYLIYLYWEPSDANQYKEYRSHHDELLEFAEDIKHTKIKFISKSYRKLWEEWDVPENRDLLNKIKERYDI